MGRKRKDPRRPEALLIGPFTWVVKWDQESWSEAFDATILGDDPDAARAYGMTDKRSCTIWMNPNNAETFLRETLFHEIMHACQFIAGLSNSKPVVGEDFITRVSPLYLDALRRNPGLVEYLMAWDWEEGE
jgi:hypothetical protein